MSEDIYRRIIDETENGFFVVYHVDSKEEVYEEILSLDYQFLKLGDPPVEFFAAMEIFEKIRNNLKPGIYFCVFRNLFGSEWFKIDTRDDAENKTENCF